MNARVRAARSAWVAGVMIGCGLAGAIACGLDESGLDVGDSGLDVAQSEGGPGLPDVVVDAPLPPTCTTTDVSCLGFDAGLPDGWSPYVVERDGGACPSGDYTSTSWVTNPHLAPNACNCSCITNGTWSCAGAIDVSTGGGCNMATVLEAGVCQSEIPQTQHLQMTNTVNATSNGVGCVADASAAGATSDPVTLCAGGCDAGASFCAQQAGVRCIAADGVVACPATFTAVTIGAAATAACNACTCTPSDAPACTATATLYYGYGGAYIPNTTCATGGQWTNETLNLDGTCQAATRNFDSLEAAWNTPSAPTCTPTAGGGDAGLAAAKTICCK